MAAARTSFRSYPTSPNWFNSNPYARWSMYATDGHDFHWIFRTWFEHFASFTPDHANEALADLVISGASQKVCNTRMKLTSLNRQVVVSRFWKLKFTGNYGDSFSLALNGLKFVHATPGKAVLVCRFGFSWLAVATAKGQFTVQPIDQIVERGPVFGRYITLTFTRTQLAYCWEGRKSWTWPFKLMLGQLQHFNGWKMEWISLVPLQVHWQSSWQQYDRIERNTTGSLIITLTWPLLWTARRCGNCTRVDRDVPANAYELVCSYCATPFTCREIQVWITSKSAFGSHRFVRTTIHMTSQLHNNLGCCSQT